MVAYTPHVYRAPPPTISRGTVLLDFGQTPVPEASVAVTGQDGILPTAHIHVVFEGSSDNISDEEHILAGQSIFLLAGTPQADGSFMIYAESSFALWTGSFPIRWSWWN